MFQRTRHRLFIPVSVMISTGILYFTAAASVVIAQEDAPPAGPPMIFSAPLPDVPGKTLQVVELSFAPNSNAPSTADDHGPGHRHPGSVLVYVVEGSVRLAIAGEPVQVIHAGETFFEPPEAHHVITENASATEPARAIAIMIVPEGEPHIHR